MNPLLCNPSEFCALVQRFFAERLIVQQNASPRTVVAYRDTFGLLLPYAQDTVGKVPTALSLGEFDAHLILGFLDYLESVCHNSIRSRNARLGEMHARRRSFVRTSARCARPTSDITAKIQSSCICCTYHRAITLAH